MDKITMIKLATSMTKSAICGTESGILASAAAAAGMSSLFSFGATAGKAVELTAASVDKGAGSAAHVATNIAGKLAQQAATAAMNQVMSNISQLVGVDLTGLYSELTSIISESTNMIAETKDLASQTTLKTEGDLGIKSDGQSSEPIKSEGAVSDTGSKEEPPKEEEKEVAVT
jgi:hypothetical protein